MGGGTYSTSDRSVRSTSLGYDTKSTNEIFKASSINNAMSPYGIGIRESRDSDEHPESLAIILALDVTGSMGSVPHFLVKKGLPSIVDSIIKGGIADPQILFLGIGDHQCDSAPLQVGQFESSDELLDKWLTDIYLEGGGGANAGESYMLAWYFAALHTDIDCLDKRGRKGYLFTVGDEPVLDRISQGTLKRIMGDGQYEDFTSAELYSKAMEKYDVYHIHIKETQSGSRQEVIDGWRQIASDHLIVADRRVDVANIISSTIIPTVSVGAIKKETASDTIEEVML